jgi:hypothetical protein
MRMRKILMAMEDLLSRIPRVVLLLLAVLVLRNPLSDGEFSSWGWYFKMPVEFLLLLFVSLAFGAAVRVGSGYGDEGPARAGKRRG